MLLLGVNYSETCQLNCMRSSGYFHDKGSGLKWLWWYPALTVRFESCSWVCCYVDKTCPRAPAGHGGMRILEREDDISFFVQHIDGRLLVVRRRRGHG